ncbi:hypothetical protein BH24ACT15_BH24ACT15_25120 [soil metagenome]
MAAQPFLPALQRTSDEQWVTLQPVAREDGRVVARVESASRLAAVVRIDGGAAYESRLRDLLASPPPHGGRGVHIAWPIDLLHDLDGTIVGYTARRHTSRHTLPLAAFADPDRRVKISPQVTRRRLVRIARNVATATAALHHAGHAGITGRQFRIDENDIVAVVRVDDLQRLNGTSQQTYDEQRLANVMRRLLGVQEWETHPGLAALIDGSKTADGTTATAQEWFFALREALAGMAPDPA